MKLLAFACADYAEYQPDTYAGIVLFVPTDTDVNVGTEERFHTGCGIHADLDAAQARADELGRDMINSGNIANYYFDAGMIEDAVACFVPPVPTAR